MPPRGPAAVAGRVPHAHRQGRRDDADPPRNPHLFPGAPVRHLTARWFNHLPEQQAIQALAGTGLPEALVADRPLLDVTPLLEPLLGKP